VYARLHISTFAGCPSSSLYPFTIVVISLTKCTTSDGPCCANPCGLVLAVWRLWR
jgi:hypothetical protein